MKRESGRTPQFVRGYRILQYLKEYSDRDHPVKQAKMRKNSEMARLMGSQDTYNGLIFSLAEALNCAPDESVLPERDWQIVFDYYAEKYGFKESNNEPDVEDDDEKKRESTPIRNLYYQHIFSYEEIDALIEGIWFSKTLSNDKRNQIVDKIKKHLTSKYYRDNYQGVLGIREPVLANREQMEKNLTVIREAIGGQKRLSFQFNGYDRHKKLIPAGEWRRVVSPYYIVANGGRYYLIGGWDAKGDQSPRMCIYRIDLMTGLEVLPDKRLPKRKVGGLPSDWNEDFALSHLNMFHDEPERIRLKITCEPHQWTFLHDYFGSTFEVRGEDVVVVNCSPMAMVHWALQYSDRVEVLHPEHVRQQVAEKVRELKEKYGV